MSQSLHFKSKPFSRILQILTNCCNLHTTNPEKVTMHLLEMVSEAASEPISQQTAKSSSTTLTESTMQLLAHMFSVEDKVAISLSPIRGVQARSEELYGNSESIFLW
jgi:hypothetical protein